jgi:uncharacterized protein (DUF4415 family)
MAEDRIVKLLARLEDGSYVVQHADGRLERQRDATDWARLRSMTEEEIEAAAAADPDNPPLDDAFFATAKPVELPRKRRVTMMLDADVIDFFGQQGRGYQTRINAVLRRYMQAAKRAS